MLTVPCLMILSFDYPDNFVRSIDRGRRMPRAPFADGNDGGHSTALPWLSDGAWPPFVGVAVQGVWVGREAAGRRPRQWRWLGESRKSVDRM